MTGSGAPRRTRLRLARQRPGPSRVRARERAEDSEKGTRFGGLNLLTVGAVVTIVASIGGLVATGVGTIYNARVAADQLNESREQHDDQQREQASRVSIWNDGGLSQRIHLLNRSPDPVADVHLSLNAVWNIRESRSVAFNLLLRGLPPCSETVIDTEDLRYSPGKGFSGNGWDIPTALQLSGLAPIPDSASLRVRGLWFVDRDGESWSRKEGVLAHDPVEGAEGELGLDTKEPQVRSASGCGADDAGT